MADDAAVYERIRNVYMKGVFRIHENEVCFDCLVENNESVIAINDHSVAVNFLRHFGDLVHRVRVGSVAGNFSLAEHTELSHSIAANCAESLVELQLFNAGGYLVGESEQVFPNVKSVAVYGASYEGVQFALDRIYPHLEKLIVGLTNPQPMESLVRTYEHLATLFMVEHEMPPNNNHLMRLLQLNPQIHNLSVNYMPNTETIEFISEHLKSLESVSFECTESSPIHADIVQPIVHFAGVRTLTILAPSRCPSVIPLTFDHLDAVKFDRIEGIDENAAKVLLFMLPDIGTVGERELGVLPHEWQIDHMHWVDGVKSVAYGPRREPSSPSPPKQAAKERGLKKWLGLLADFLDMQSGEY